MPVKGRGGRSDNQNKRSMDGESNPASDCQSDNMSDSSTQINEHGQFDAALRRQQENISKQSKLNGNSDEIQQRNSHDDIIGFLSAHSSPSTPGYKKLPKTPKTFPRTKVTSRTPIAQKVALQSLRQHMSFSNCEHANCENPSPEEMEDEKNAGAVGTSCSMHHQTNLPSINDMLSKMVQLQDDINQVTRMIDNLAQVDSSPQIQQHLDRLIRVRKQMLHSEAQLKALFHKMNLALREEAAGRVENECDGLHQIQQNGDHRYKINSGRAKREKIESEDDLNELDHTCLPAYLLRASSESRTKEDDGMVPERLNQPRSLPASMPLLANLPSNATNLEESAPMFKDIVEQRDKLKFKLMDLKDKKDQMESLLTELSHLKGMQNNGRLMDAESQVSGSSNKPHDMRNESISDLKYDPCASAVRSLLDAEKHLHSTKELPQLELVADDPERCNELKTMKEKLSELRRIVSLYESQNGHSERFGDELADGQIENKRNICVPLSAIGGPRRENKNDSSIRGQRDYSPEGYCSADEAEDSESRGGDDQTVLEDWSDNLQVQRKIRKLNEVKDKLGRLQDLIAKVQRAKEKGISVPADCKELLRAIEDADNDASDEIIAIREDEDLEIGATGIVQSPANEEPNYDGMDECNAKIKEEKCKLDKIMDEKKKIFDDQQQLFSLHHDFSQQFNLNNSTSAIDRRSAGDYGAVVSNNRRSESFANFTFHPNFHSNSDYQRDNCAQFVRNDNAIISNESGSGAVTALRDELQRQSEVLKELMREEKEKRQSFSRNQDNISTQSLKSNDKSSLAATWVLPTPHNFQDEINQRNLDGSQDEHEVYNDSEDEEDLFDTVIRQPQSDVTFRAPRLSNLNIAPTVEAPIRSDAAVGSNISTGANRQIDERQNHLPDVARPLQSTSNEINGSDRREIRQQPTSVANCNRDGVFDRSSSAHLLQRIEENTDVCRSILRDQHALTNLIQSIYATGNTQNLMTSIINTDQQTRYNFQQCFNMMFQQQMDIHQIQQQLNQLLRSLQFSDINSANASNHVSQNTLDGSSPNNHQTNPSCFQPMPMSGLLNTNASLFGPYVNTHPVGDPPKTLNNQVAPGSRANNYWDNFRSCSRQNLFPGHRRNHQQTDPFTSVPPPPQPPTCVLPAQFPATHHQTPTLSVQLDDNLSARGATNGVDGSQAVNSSENYLRKSLKSNKDQKPDPKNFCSENRVTVETRQTPIERNFREDLSTLEYPRPPFLRVKPPPTTPKLSAGNKTIRPNTNDLSNLEQVYSEAASLISENESRPDYLMELFSKLKLIDSDDYRQNALYSLHDLSAKSIRDNRDNFTDNSERNLRKDNGSAKLAVAGGVSLGASNRFKLSNEEDSQISSSNKHFKYVTLPQHQRSAVSSSKKQNSSPSSLPLSLATNHSTVPTLSTNRQFFKDLTSDGNNGTASKDSPVQPQRGSKAASEMAKFTGAIKKRRMCAVNHDHPTEEEQADASNVNGTTDPWKIDSKVENIIMKMMPFVRVNIDEYCQPKMLNSICRLIVTLYRETIVECNATDPPEYLQHQCKRMLQDATFKYTGRRLRDCIEEMLSELSNIIYDDLAYVLLIKQIQRPTSSTVLSNVKSIVQSLNLDALDTDIGKIDRNEPRSLQASTALSRRTPYHVGSRNDTSAAKLHIGSPSTDIVDDRPLLSEESPIVEGEEDKIDNREACGTQSLYISGSTGVSRRDEVETEPEAENISNKDLAEADQSPQLAAACQLSVANLSAIGGDVNPNDNAASLDPNCNACLVDDNVVDLNLVKDGDDQNMEHRKNDDDASGGASNEDVCSTEHDQNLLFSNSKAGGANDHNQ